MSVTEQHPGVETADRSRHRTVRFHNVTSADGTVLEAWTNDAEGPTVLLCNGLGTNPYAWPGLLDPDCGVRIISWNHRGVGRSERPADLSRVDVPAFVEDALAVLDDGGVDSCVVMGWSIGVNTAFELAVRHPERVTGLFAVAGVPGSAFASMGAPLRIPRPLREPMIVKAAKVIERFGQQLTKRITHRIQVGPATTAILRHSGFIFPSAKPDDVRRCVREFLTTPLDWYMHLAIHCAEHRQVSLSQIDVPSVFISGRQDIIASADDMRTAADEVRDSSYLELRGSHFLCLEQPDLINRELHDLLARVG